MRSFLRALGLLLLAALILAAASGVWAWREFDATGPLAAEKETTIAAGLGTAGIARQLAQEGIVRHELVFRLGAHLFAGGRSLKAGEFRFPAGISPRGALAVLTEGKAVLHRLTVSEGLTRHEIAALLMAEGRLSGPLPPLPPEGSLLPETYFFVRGDSRAALLERMREKMTATLAELWQRRAPDLPLRSPAEAVILASLVEKETGRKAERAHIAGVFYNRLARDIKLQADPTVVYALTEGKAPLARALTKADLALDSPYNTYRMAGLPPGPITNPGRAALLAVLHPKSTRDLFFVADGKGGHAFAETLAEHNTNVAKWRAFLGQQAAESAPPDETAESE